ncbi:hypothetical protein LCGC14_0389550 [marine sediment metagenome]|uniref:Uncharacterized protein n=1 Tax=marine sediment metagenome TaxID=412755 RepID=A0A0F9W8Y9_9ZZZZ
MADTNISPGAAQLTLSTSALTLDRDLTADNYTGDADNFWDGGVLGGIPVINNGIDVPQAWNPITGGTKLVDLANWPSATTAKIVKPFRNYLIAMNITQSATDKPHMIWWSHQADPGTIPDSWDHSDATKDAGRFELTDVNAGVIQDGEALGDFFMIYKDNATHGLQFVGGSFIWRRFNVFTATGILAQRCVAVLPVMKGKPSRHLLATGDDIIVHNGRTADSVLDKRMRKFLNSNMDPTNYTRSYMTINPRYTEGWFCFPEQGEDFPTLAIVWNYVDDTLGVRDLTPGAAFIAAGVVSEAAASRLWDDMTGTWDESKETWGARQFTPQEVDLLQCSPAEAQLLHLDNTNQLAGVNMNSSLERTGLAASRLDRFGRPVIDITRRKLATRLWPRMTGGPVELRLGSQEEIGGTVTWTEAKTFTPGTDNYVDFDAPANGRLLALRIESNTDVAWTIEGYDIDIAELGEI